ncbi:TetR-like C-terminal domain-containing protein [Afipia sp. Root123D2]|uniref:TetR-like C-terminal domain-containing protein n=1 Tax=Afipia sp. Root123D2 TaxID=1736436 RepID=UPI00138F1E72|nr:TetR-like C-terminal domain-containing protein [Afipia sp. Root123D2]
MKITSAKTHSDPNVTHVLRTAPSRWDRQIVADLIAEMQERLSENLDSVPAMRSALAVAGYRALRGRIENAVKDKQGTDALRSMVHAMRSFALGSPGLAAASFRNPVLDSQEWATAGKDLADTVFKVFEGVGITGYHAKHAVRILRSLVRGFVLNEMVSAAAHPLEFQKSYNCAVEMFIAGLPTLTQTHFEAEAYDTQDTLRRAYLV